jgi:hypothetical protein
MEGSSVMDISKALNVLEDVAADHGVGMLDLLQYMTDNLDDFSEEDVKAYRIAMRDFRKLFATKECA